MTFLLLATLIVVGAMVLFGKLVSDQISGTITEGVAETAAASMDVMLADELAEIGPARPLTTEARDDLDALFSAANDARLNKLVQIRLNNADGSLLYQSLSGLLDTSSASSVVAAAREGKTSSELLDLPLVPIGPLAHAALPTLKVTTPVHDRTSGAIIATAELYFGARNLVDLERQAQRNVWITVAIIGLGAVGALFLLVDRTGSTIARQRRELAASLSASQALAEENGQLRQQANVANERLLAQVGSDLHDGPLQMLALLILKLSRRQAGEGEETAAIAQQVMEDVRNISAGLVLPELSALRLGEVIALGIRRHEEINGTPVRAQLADVPDTDSPDLKVCVYRVLQEGLANAQRHGLPDSTTVLAEVRGEWLTLEISNDVAHEEAEGRQPAHRPPQLGLAGMRARLEAVGGRLSFDQSGSTARLVVDVPLGGSGEAS